MSDCALEIAKGIQLAYPETILHWCAVHVMRALRNKLNEFVLSKDDKAKIDKIMNCLANGRNTKLEWVQNNFDEISKFLENNQEAINYFQTQWFSNQEKWVAANRDIKYSLTNNISESINKKVISLLMKKKR